MSYYDIPEIKTIDFQEVESQFGFCPECKSPLSYLSTGPQREKACCHDCKVWAPSNMTPLGDWGNEDEDTWRENRHKLMTYKKVKPLYVLGGYDGAINAYRADRVLEKHLNSNGLNSRKDVKNRGTDLPF